MLKRHALISLGLNFEIVASRIDMIEIEIPWMTIFTDNMKINISGVDISIIAKPDQGATKAGLSKDFKIQDMNRLKREALIQTEANYLRAEKQVTYSYRE